MAGSTFGNIFKITTWGESHGKAIGVVVDGCPAGIEIDEDLIQVYLDRRKPGQNRFSTQRNESDQVEILSGVFEGKTTGTPISMLVKNEDHHSADYSEIASYYRPGHADFTYDEKYGFRDYRGGGRSSGRETIGRVAAGAIALEALKQMGVYVNAYTSQIGNVKVDRTKIELQNILKSPIYMPDLDASKRATEALDFARSEMDSMGGMVDCVVTGLPSGVGEPVFDKLNANIAKAVMSIGAVKCVQIGDGLDVVISKGSDNNDEFTGEKPSDNKQRIKHFFDEDGNLISNIKSSNHAGGILGGISDSDPILVSAAFKPTPSIAKTQKTINKFGEQIDINIKGRHDPIIVPRAVVVVEAMVALTVFDSLLVSMTSRMDRIVDFFSRK
ncbi:MAG: chorismate synthase [Lachnospiraceae bacterium]|nr:chorismate synthase [Lachnospiraceae bacterium]